MRRRKFIQIGAISGIAALAGCSDQSNTSTGGNGTPQSGDTTTPTLEKETATEVQTETEQEEQLYEENESGEEREFENLIKVLNDNAIFWIEMENLSEQLPERNINTERFPSLKIFNEEPRADGGIPPRSYPYNAEEAFYLLWGDRAYDNNDQVVLDGAIVDYYGSDDEGASSLSIGPSSAYTDEDPDITGILDEVVEGYDDISENMSEEHLNALQS